MSKVSVFDREWIDLVFEGRNKEYGAYQLRKESSKTTILALFSSIALIGTLVAIPYALSYFKSETADIPTDSEGIILVNDVVEPFKPAEPEKPKPEAPQQQAAAPASATATVAFTQLQITNTPVEPLPTTTDFVNADPGSQTTPGSTTGTIVIGTPPGTGPATSTGTGITGTGDEPISSNLVDESPMFMNGLDDFRRLVADKFDLPETSEKMTLKVFVSFIVEKDGTMSDIKVLKDPGYGMGEEAIRVLKSIKTKWKPGKKGGKEVRTAFSIPIVLNLK